MEGDDENRSSDQLSAPSSLLGTSSCSFIAIFPPCVHVGCLSFLGVDEEVHGHAMTGISENYWKFCLWDGWKCPVMTLLKAGVEMTARHVSYLLFMCKGRDTSIRWRLKARVTGSIYCIGGEMSIS